MSSGVTAGSGAGGGGDCVPQCAGKTCGDDGCGSMCGVCAAGSSCSAGQCVADPPPPPPPGGGSESEPNGDPSKANALGAGGKIQGVISTVVDSDWYTWKVPAGATYTVDLQTPHEYVMTLFKVTSGSSLYEIGSAFDEIQKQTPNGGVYYLEVWGGNGDYSPSDKYTVSVSIIP